MRAILADLALLAFRRAVLGPIADALSGVFGGGGSVAAAVSHAGGIVGLSGHSRQVPALAFAGAPRMHSGGYAGLRPDEVPTILQRGERVLSRSEVARGMQSGATPVQITVNVEGANGDRQIMEMVSSGVSAAINQYDRQVLPYRIAETNKNPRRVG